MPTYVSYGSNANDTLTGTTGADTLRGGAGDDLYLVNHLGDYVIENSDTVIGFGGTDTVRTSVLNALKTYTIENWIYIENLEYSGTAAAQLKGNSGANVIKANAATITNDTLYGGDGNDSLYGYGGNDSLIGGYGNDYLDGGTGNDMMVGGYGNDTYVIDAAGDVALEVAGAGFDTLRTTGATGKDLRVGWAANMEGVIYTSTAATALYGNIKNNYVVSLSNSNDTLYGYNGNDTLGGGGGADSLIGGQGDDVFIVDTSDTVVENLNEGRDTFWGTKTDISVTPYADRIENLIYTGATGAVLKGNNLGNVVGGGTGNDNISGFDGNDSIFGAAGSDTLTGGNGNDWLYGGGQRDEIAPEAGFGNGDLFHTTLADGAADTLIGGGGDDRYLIDESLDTIVEAATGGGFDTIVSKIDISLNDARYANVEAVVLDDGVVNTVIMGGNQPWFAEGNSQANVLVGNQSENYLSGAGGNDTLAGNVDNNSGYSSMTVDVLDGGDGNDVLIAAPDNGYTYGMAGNVLLGGAGNDTYVIRNSNNVMIYDTSGTDVALLLKSADLTGSTGVETIALYGGGDTALESAGIAAINQIYRAYDGSAAVSADMIASASDALNIIGSDDNNRIVGNNYNNQLDGGAGNDSIIGNDGNDTLIGGAGIDTLVGGAGNDTYVIETGDVIVEAANAGIDVIRSAVLTTYSGYANIEGLEYVGAANVTLQNAVGNTSADRFSGGFGNDTVRGYGGNDTLAGGAGNDSIEGGDGADSVSGDDGADMLKGDAGNDVIVGGLGADTITGGDGNDTIYGYSSLYFDGAYGGNDAGAGNNISGDAGNDYIAGADGNDSISGGAGVDTIYGYDGNDSISGGDGADSIFGYDGNDTLSGGNGDDYLAGGSGNDIIYAGGADINTGSFGLSGDRMSGDDFASDGADIFRFETSAAFGSGVAYPGAPGYFSTGHVITDFGVGDKIQFAASMVGDGDLLIENQVTKATSGGTFSSVAEMVIVGTNLATDRSFDYSFGNSIAASEITAVIGNASSAYAVGDKRLFVVDDGNDSMLFQFVSSDANATISESELKLIGVVQHDGNMTGSDFGLY